MKYNSRQDRVTAARRWTAIMNEKYHDEIQHSIQNTRQYRNTIPPVQYIGSGSVSETVIAADTVSAAFSQPPDSNVALLNFASYLHPGSGFLQGSTAQEESLCHKVSCIAF